MLQPTAPCSPADLPEGPLLEGPDAAGGGRLAVARVAGQSAVVAARAFAPLKLLVPRPRGRCVWAYVTTFGGGLLPGDVIDLDLDVGPGASALLATQASTKVFKSDGRPARQALRARVEDGALLAVLPDPVTCFAEARYTQRQRVALAPGGSLVLLDWVTAGRAARGERWSFDALDSATAIHVDERLIARDALYLAGDIDAPLDARFGRHDVLATVTLIGPALAAAAEALCAQVAAMAVTRGAPLLASASPLASAPGGGAVLRVVGERVEDVAAFVRAHLRPALTPLLGEDPWARR